MVTVRYWAAAKHAAGVAEETFDAATLAEAVAEAVARRQAGARPTPSRWARGPSSRCCHRSRAADRCLPRRPRAARGEAASTGGRWVVWLRHAKAADRPRRPRRAADRGRPDLGGGRGEPDLRPAHQRLRACGEAGRDDRRLSL